MFQCQLSKDFWAEVANMAYYLINSSPSNKLQYKPAFEVWYGTFVDYSSLTV